MENVTTKTSLLYASATFFITSTYTKTPIKECCISYFQPLNTFYKIQEEKKKVLYTPRYFPFVPLSSLLMLQVSFKYHFPAIWRTSFNNSFQAGLLPTTILSFLSSENVSNSPPALEDIVTSTRFWVDSSFLQHFEDGMPLPSGTSQIGDEPRIA